MRSSRRKLLSRLMCFVMGLSCGTNAGAHQKKKSSSNESLNLPEKVVVGSTFFMIYKLILKPLGSRLLSRSGNNKNNIKYIKKEYDDNNAKYVKFNDSENDEPKNIKYVIKINDENYGELERRNYIQNVLNSIDKTVDKGSEYEWLRTVPNSLDEIRIVLHYLFLNYLTSYDYKYKNAKLTIDDEKINWSYQRCKETEEVLKYEEVYKVLKWYHQSGLLKTFNYYDNSVVPLKRFGIVIQKWVQEMGFSKVEIVTYNDKNHYYGDCNQCSIELKIHGFKYQLSDKERQNLIGKLELKGGDILDLINDDEEIEENIEDKNNIIIVKKDNYNSDDEY